MRNLSKLDHMLASLNQQLLAKVPVWQVEAATKNYESGALMRVNHTGEIAAQALYHGQAVFARDPEVKAHLKQAAAEEQAHLEWCEQRTSELGTHVSRLGPFWYWGSYSIGLVAGMAGDHWSLGFIKETEDQVVEHLQSHLEKLPAEDTRSREIVTNMIKDEARHAADAEDAGAQELPAFVKQAMRLSAKVMTSLSYKY